MHNNKPNKMTTLRLSLKTKWFEITKAGIKTEDYREITPYWAKRLLLYQGEPLIKHLNKSDIQELCDDLNNATESSHDVTSEVWYHLDNWFLTFKKFDTNQMTLGYPKSDDHERILNLEHKGIEMRTGNPEWGAEPNKLYFVILHGNVIQF